MYLSTLSIFLSNLAVSSCFLVDKELLNTLVNFKNIVDGIQSNDSSTVVIDFDGVTKFVTTYQKRYEVISQLYADGCSIEEAMGVMERFPIQSFPYEDGEWRKCAIKAELLFHPGEDEEKAEEEGALVYW